MKTAAVYDENIAVAMWSDMDRWVIPTSAMMGGILPKGWTTAKVGEVAKLLSERIRVEPHGEYKMAGVRWYGEGVFHRETVPGKKLSAKYVAPLTPGALIYNRLFAWKASFAVVPADLGDCHVSNEFPQFLADETKLLPEFLYLWAISDKTIRAVNAASTGSAAVSRNRFREEFFLEFDLPLPPLHEQGAIVSAWQRAKVEIADIQRRISELEDKVEVDFLAGLGLIKPEQIELPNVFSINWSDFNRWSIEYIRRNRSEAGAEKHKYPLHLLCDLCNGQSGSTPSKRDKTYWNGEIPWVSPKDMKADWITDTIDHISRDAVDPGGAPIIPQGSVLVVVRSGILQHKVPIAVNMVEVSINQDMRALIPKPDAPISADFLSIYLRCMQHKLLSQVKWSTTVQSINKESIEALEIPLPPLDIQKRLVEKVYSQCKIIDQLKAEADQKTQQAKTDVEAMILGIKPVPDAN